MSALGGVSRILTLTIRFNWASKAKFALLAVLVAVGMTVFLVVTELSRVSSEGLDEAISEDIGETGTYRIELSSSFGISLDMLGQQVEKALAPYAAKPPTMIEVFPAITPECPPYEALGRQSMLILRDSAGQPVELPDGQDLPVDTEICLDGQEIPAAAIYLPSQSEQAKWGIGIVVDDTYRQVVAMSTNLPITYSFVVVTNQQTDQRDALQRSVTQQLEDDALRHGVDVSDSVFVFRVDTGESIRSASEGIKVVYAIIGWGVIVLGGLGLLVSELIVVRDRMWFFGLARAVGARSGHIASLIFADVLLILSVGTTLAIVISLAIQPAASSFAIRAFQVDIELLQPTNIPKLVAGALLILVLAGFYPALIATRHDPLDVLEPKVS